VDHSEYLAGPGVSRLAHSGACWDYFEVTVTASKENSIPNTGRRVIITVGD
jgi:hypothetical protein